MKKQISYKAAFSFGFSSFIDNIFTFIILWLFYFLLFGIIGILKVSIGAPFFANSDTYTSLSALYHTLRVPSDVTVSLFISLLGSLVLFEAYHYQLIQFSLAVYEDKPISWKQLFIFSWRSFSSYWVARFVRGFLIVIGMCLLFIPGIYWMCTYYFAGYSLVEGTCRKVSEDRLYARLLTQGVHWQILGFVLIVQILSIAIAATAMVALPIIYLATVHVYKQLQQQESEKLAERSLHY